MTIENSQEFSSFATLNRYFAISEPTIEIAEQAILSACNFHGAANEEEIRNCGNVEVIENFNKIKSLILQTINK
ncbi:hypothetical protein [Paenibacillus sp. SI8]|uniref:hypothetical protein n=1 Tax=unclassified Paenibacillus TaxID=185978 RepID=UPI0034679BE0